MNARVIVQTVFCNFHFFFFIFFFSVPSKVIIQFMFLGINMFWALLRAHFNAHFNKSELGPKHIYAR